MKDKIKDYFYICVITLFVILFLFLWLPFIPQVLSEYTPEPLKTILTWIANYGVAISFFQP